MREPRNRPVLGLWTKPFTLHAEVRWRNVPLTDRRSTRAAGGKSRRYGIVGPVLNFQLQRIIVWIPKGRFHDRGVNCGGDSLSLEEAAKLKTEHFHAWWGQLAHEAAHRYPVARLVATDAKAGVSKVLRGKWEDFWVDQKSSGQSFSWSVLSRSLAQSVRRWLGELIQNDHEWPWGTSQGALENSPNDVLRRGHSLSGRSKIRPSF